MIKLLNSKGYITRPIHKPRSDAAGGFRPSESGPENAGELKIKLRGIVFAKQEGYINFVLPFLIQDICKLTGLGIRKGAYEVRSSWIYERCVHFSDRAFAHIFYSRFCSHYDDQGSTVIRCALENENFRQINNKEPQLMVLKSATNTIGVEAFEAAADGAVFDIVALGG